MSGVLRHWQQPEWSARALWDFAESVKAKTHEYNPSADDWRLMRPDDIPGGVAGEWRNTVAMLGVPLAYQTMIPAAAGFRVPQGIGIGFYGFWISGIDLGLSAGYRVLINGVRRIEVPIHEFMSDSKGANKLLDTGATGYIYFFHVHYIHLEQLVFARENDIVMVQLAGSVVIPLLDFEFYPLAIIAGNSKQLLTNA